MTQKQQFLGDDRLREAVFETAPHGYLILDTDFTIVDVNLQYLDLTGTRREDLIGAAMFDAFPDNPRDPTADGVRNLRRSLETVLSTRRPHAMLVQKYDIPRRDCPEGGFEERYWKPLNTPILHDGEVVALVHHAIDVTEETIFRRDQAIRLRSAQQIDDLAFWEYDPRTSTIYATHAFARLLSFPEREGTLNARKCFARIHPDDRAGVQAAFAAVMDAPDHTPVAFAHRLMLPDGTTQWLSSQGELVRDHREALPRFVVVSLDISASKRQEEALADRTCLLAQKETLLSEVNHRIKNSLQLVSSILNMDAYRATPEAARARLERAAARVQAVASVHEMLYRSNEVTTVAFGAHLRELCASFGRRAQAGVEVVCDLVEVRLPTDTAIALALVVNELMLNAVQHGFGGRGKGVVLVTTRMDDAFLVLEVADDGVGRDAGAKPGLGTRIVQGLVGQLDASIELSEGAPGHRVVITTPIEVS